MPAPDYYGILEISPTAEPAAIKAAYRTLARRWHPDANLDNILEAENRFKELSEAYEILGNREKRAKYDVFRPRVRRAGTTPAAAPRPTSEPKPASRPEQTVQSEVGSLSPVVIASNAERRKADPELERAYTTFAAAFDREDEKSKNFTGFFDTFMNVRKS